MKTNYILSIIVPVLLLSCKKDCDKNCNGFNKDTIEFQFSPFQKEIETLLYTNEDNNKELELNLDYFEITEERFLESECGNFVDIFSTNSGVKSCDEEFFVSYEYNYNSTTAIFLFYLNYDQDYPENIDYSISFDKDITTTDIIFEDSIPKIRNETSEYSVELLDDDTLLITNNSTPFRENTIKKIWIKKSIGIIRIELDNQIWE